MITLSELDSYLKDLLQKEAVPDYCQNGIQVEGQAQISSIATAVTASLDVIKKAAALGAQALIVHHGLFWKGDSYVIAGPKREKLQLLLQHGISVLAYHLPLDLHREFGNNWKAAQEMGWGNLEPFGMHNGVPVGVKGNVPSQSRDEFRKLLERYYEHNAQCVFGGKERVSTVALISGGAHKNIADAIAEGVDCYVTGTTDEPIWHQAHEGQINFFALGHSATERIGPRALGKHLQEHFKLKHQFIDIPNPF